MKFKKILLISASLLLIGSVNGLSVNASHVHHHYHHKVVRVVRQHDLTYRQLQKAMAYDYKKASDKYTKRITMTLKHNLCHYSNHQIENILNSRDADPYMSSDFTAKELTNIQNMLYNRKSMLKELSNQHSAYNDQLRQALINDINKLRIAHGVKPLKVSGVAQRTANHREPYVQKAIETYSTQDQTGANFNTIDNAVHGVTGNTTDDEFMAEHFYNFKHFGENVANWSPTFTGDTPNSTYNYYGVTMKYNDDTPTHTAYNINDIMINHDKLQGNNNGHRDTELSPQYHYIGVSVSYNAQKQLGGLNEQYL